MFTHDMKLQKRWFDCVKIGTKTIEGRLYDKKRRSINVGDTIIFSCENEEINVLVTQVVLFKSFEESMKSVNIDRLLPGNDYMSGLSVYKKIYTAIEEEKYGVVMIYFSSIY